jgi:LysR family transcriptional regulator, low CO2-responsive transcriptional regulator
MIPSEWLQAFATFSEDANLSRAARRLHLSQPAVHAQLKKLEAALGVPLYRRAGRGLVLTREGVEVAAFARESDERDRDLVARLRGEGAARRVVLAAGPGAIVHVVSAGLRAFARKERPATRVEVVTANATHALELVGSGVAHVGVAALAAPPSAEAFESHLLVEAPQVLVMPKGHRLAQRRRLSVTDLDGERLVVPPDDGPQRMALDAALAGAGARITITAVARGWDVVLRLVELDIGLGIVNGTCAIPRGLAARPLSDMPRVRYFAFTRRSPRPSAKALVLALRSVR